jgi:phosphoribosylanthranilate isomerase
MRSIPIAPSDRSHLVPTLETAKVFEATSDYFLTDTLLVGNSGSQPDPQPVQGFVGITGQTCCWRTAAELVEASNLPVILAGGISPGNVAAGIQKTRPAGISKSLKLCGRLKRPWGFEGSIFDILRFAVKHLNIDHRSPEP